MLEKMDTNKSLHNGYILLNWNISPQSLLFLKAQYPGFVFCQKQSISYLVGETIGAYTI